MNGAEALVASLGALGVRICFANPGTSELHVVAALDGCREIRSVLCLHEGVATGAADGFGRMAGRPAATLLHLGPGLANGIAGLHNARRARTPLVNVVGDHPAAHRPLDPPLEADVRALAATVSRAVLAVPSPAGVGETAAEAVRLALRPPGGVATIVMPADVAWSPGGCCASARAEPGNVDAAAVERAAALLRAGGGVLLLGGPALSPASRSAAARAAGATGARVLGEAFPSRLRQGKGLPHLERLRADPAGARRQLAGCRGAVLAGARRPAAAFARPDGPGTLLPDGCAVEDIAGEGADPAAALEVLASELSSGPPGSPLLGLGGPAERDAAPVAHDGDRITPDGVAVVLAELLPDDGVVVDEGNSAGRPLAAALAGAAPHDLLTVSGFAIGHGMPMAAGAALACPGRRVVCVEADGSAMYALPALWTQARESLDVATVVLKNRAYEILRREGRRLGNAPPGWDADSPLFDLSRPDLSYATIAAGMGVPASRAATVGELRESLRRALAGDGPHLVEATLGGDR